jgi:HAD superfamily hydrolase (TIGR01456 family)
MARSIDGVLVRSSNPIPGAHEALSYLQNEKIPFILLTNGGGKTEAERTAYLENKLQVPLSENMIVQSHTPFADLKQYHDKCVLIVGGDYDGCKKVAQSYGYKNVVTPYEILCAYPTIWPFSKMYLDTYKKFAEPLPKPIDPNLPDEENLKIDAIFIYNDSRDWGLDSTIILDTLLSRSGILSTLSKKNGDKSLPNDGYLQDNQPPLYYSNPDLWWAGSYHLNRLGQGGFQSAFQGLWDTVTGGAKLERTLIGKPTQATYEFSENRLRANRKALWGQVGLNDPLRRVYMVGDNPESDIRGANDYRSPHGSRWTSILVQTGVYRGIGEPSCRPDIILDDVRRAVEWAVEDARKK